MTKVEVHRQADTLKQAAEKAISQDQGSSTVGAATRGLVESLIREAKKLPGISRVVADIQDSQPGLTWTEVLSITSTIYTATAEAASAVYKPGFTS